ncbi:chemoreceptor glutamine deamidase CheD [Pseudomonadota bacterium]
MSLLGSKELPPALSGFERVKRYWDRSNDVVAAKILPGEYYVTTQDEMVTTVLGSCVSACIRDRVFGVGGMNHFMLPLDTTGEGWSGSSDLLSSATRYGNFAMEHMINDILKNGGRRKNLEAKVFGGGQIIATMTDVGRKNIDFVLSYLEQEGLAIASQDLGDIYPRKVNYYPASGRVRVKRLRHLHNDTIVRREQSYRHELEEQPVEGGIELF